MTSGDREHTLRTLGFIFGQGRVTRLLNLVADAISPFLGTLVDYTTKSQKEWELSNQIARPPPGEPEDEYRAMLHELRCETTCVAHRMQEICDGSFHFWVKKQAEHNFLQRLLLSTNGMSEKEMVDLIHERLQPDFVKSKAQLEKKIADCSWHHSCVLSGRFIMAIDRCHRAKAAMKLS